MRALVYKGPHEVVLTSVPDARLLDDLGAVVRLTATGVCGSDLHAYEGHLFNDETGYCMGHEGVGEIVEVGPAVRRFAVGDRVLLPASTGCIWCAPCARGVTAGCANRREPWKAFGYGMGHLLQGCQAEAVAVPHADANLVTIPEAVSDELGLLLTDNLPTAWMGARMAGVGPGDTVAVIGLGPVGQLAVRSAFLMGAARVLAVDPVDHRRALAAAVGAEAVDPERPKEAIRELTSGEGCDAVIEAVGASASIALAASVAGYGGRVGIVGVARAEKPPFRLDVAQVKELGMAIGYASVQRELPALLPLAAAGRFDTDGLVTHHLGLSEGVEAYSMLAGRRDGVGKIVLDPSR